MTHHHDLRRLPTSIRDRILYRLPEGIVEQPFEILIGYLCLSVGLPLLIGGAAATPNSIDDLLAAWLVKAWSVALLFGGLLTVAGKTRNWQRIERAGLLLLAAATVIYGGALVGQFQLQASLAAGTYFVTSAFCVIRFWVIGHSLDVQEASGE